MSYKPHSFAYKSPPLSSIPPPTPLQRDTSLWGDYGTSSYNIKPLPSIPSINHDQSSHNNLGISSRTPLDISNYLEKRQEVEDYEQKAEKQKQENERLQEEIKNLKIKKELAIERLNNLTEMKKMKEEVELLKLQKTVGFCEKKFHDKVNQGYEKISNSKRFIKIDASKSIQSIHKKIIKNINSLI